MNLVPFFWRVPLYNGLDQRVQQTVGANTTKYVLDTGCSLWKVLAETTGANTTHYLHDPQGLLAQQRPDASWNFALEDGLGSIRGVLNSSLSPLESRQYAPYGEPVQLSGSAQSTYGFTGEAADSNGLLYLRARHYRPSLGAFFSLDPVEALNRYMYAGANPVNRIDPSGRIVTRRMIDVNDSYALAPTPIRRPSPPQQVTPTPRTPPIHVQPPQPGWNDPDYRGITSGSLVPTPTPRTPPIHVQSPQLGWNDPDYRQIPGSLRTIFDIAAQTYNQVDHQTPEAQRLRDAMSAAGGTSTEYAQMLGIVLGYNIEFSDGFSEGDRIAQLTNLASANLSIISYIRYLFPSNTRNDNVRIFSQFYGTASITNPTPITVHLGTDSVTGGSGYGLTPQPLVSAPEQLDDLYLGSQVSIATIIHEYGHQLVRYFPNQFIDNFSDFVVNRSSGQVSITYLDALRSRANQSTDFAEIVPDWHMTAILSPSPGDYYVNYDFTGDPVGYRNGNSVATQMQQWLNEYFGLLFASGSLPSFNQ